ncbi:MAG: hypothetical protein IH845_00630 [Nanoarchaeota archaeon]|nr:hypothetical protein [Nanoarchaeota archaeon]
MDGLVAVSNGVGSAFDDFAVMIRFSPSGILDARNGAVYSKDVSILYKQNVKYSFVFEIDVTLHTYSVYVTSEGGSQQTLASNYAFRSTQSTVTSLDNWGVFSGTGELSVCGFSVGSGPQQVCGDSVVNGSEVCEVGIIGSSCFLEGFDNGTLGCSANCLSYNTSACINNPAVCGNGIIESPETCDDGGIVSGDGCSATCQIEGVVGSSPYDAWSNGPSSDPNYFPINIFLQNPSNAARYKAMGINNYVALWNGPTETQLSDLNTSNMHVLTKQTSVSLNSPNINIISAWKHKYSEPDNAQPDGSGGFDPCIDPSVIQQDYALMKSNDSTRPVLLGLGRGVSVEDWIGRGTCTGRLDMYPEYLKGTDIVTFDVYPVTSTDVASGNLEYVARGVERLVNWSNGKKIVWNWIETTHVNNANVRPTVEQIRTEVWMSLVHGSMGIGYFVHEFEPSFAEAGIFRYPEIEAGVTSINARITSLAPVLNSPSVNSLASVVSSDSTVPIKYMVKQYGGDTYLFAVSMRDIPTQGTFNLIGINNATVEVLDEVRSLNVVNGVLQDSFVGYDTHLYKINNSSGSICVLDSAYWSATNATEGDVVTLTVEGTNCEGEIVDFSVWENDVDFPFFEGDFDDPVINNPISRVISGGITTTTWISEYQVDGALGIGDPPEYYFNAVLVSDSSVSIKSSDPELYVFERVSVPPIYTKFDGGTTDFGTMDYTAVTGAVLEIASFGKIEFVSQTINFEDLNLDTFVFIENNLVGIDSVALPSLNTAATLTMYGLSYTSTPAILKDGVSCGSVCSNIIYNSGTLTFDVTSFSNFTTSASGLMASSATAAGITYTFDTDYLVGYYPDKMPWVIENSPGAGVNVIAMSPNYGSGRNGWEENPVTYELSKGENGCTRSSCDEASMDSRLAGNAAHKFLSPETKYGPLPKYIAAGTSVLKVQSMISGNCWSGDATVPRTCIETAAVLTILSSVPPLGAIRPPYMGTDKPHFTIKDLDINTYFKNLPDVSNQYTWAEIENSFGVFPAPSNVHMFGEFDGRATPAQITRPGSTKAANYGCDLGMQINAALLKLSQSGTESEKDDIVYQLLSNSVDHYYSTKNGKSWASGGCIHHGRKSLIMWGGQLLSSMDQGSNNAAAAEMFAFNKGVSALDQYTYISTVTGESLWGKSPCQSLTSTWPTSSATARICDELRDGGGSKTGTGALGSTNLQKTPTQQIAEDKYSYAAYQMMSSVYFGAAAVARIYDFENEWNTGRTDNSDAFFKYTDRIAKAPWNYACKSHCDSYLTDMHRTYASVSVVSVCSIDADCDDGLFCNGIETCSGSVCQAGAIACPEDSYSCTTTCSESTDSCTTSFDDSVCSDLDSCTVNGLCTGAGGDSNGCIYDILSDGSICDDDDVSTSFDICTSGICSGTTITSCINDDNYCPSGCNVGNDNDCVDCLTTTNSWQNNVIATQSGSFSVSFDVIPDVVNMDGLVAISNGAGAVFDDFAVMIRFSTSGIIDARNGAVYSKDVSIPYTQNVKYSFVFEIDVVSHTYTVYVTPEGGSQQILALNYTFRSSQSTVTSLNNWGVYSGKDSMSVCGFSVGAVSGSQQVCGDGVVNGSEICEVGILGGATCVSQGFDSGVLNCSANCLSYDTSSCVVASNNPPVLTSIGSRTVDEGIELSIVLSASDIDGDSLSYNASNKPAGSDFDELTRTFTWTPSFSSNGTYFVNFSVSDGTDLDFEIVTITVNDVIVCGDFTCNGIEVCGVDDLAPSCTTDCGTCPVTPNNPPVLTFIGPKNISEGDFLSIIISGNDSDGDPLSYSATNLPNGSSFDDLFRTFTWTPSFSSNGTYFVNFSVSDGTDLDFEVVTITVKDVIVFEDEDSDGVPDSSDKCLNTSLGATVNPTNGCRLPLYTKFHANLTTDFSLVKDLLDMDSLSLGIWGKGKIEFIDRNMSMLRYDGTRHVPLNLDLIVIENNLIGINTLSNDYGGFDKPARLTLYNVVFSDPQILRDGVLCSECVLLGNASGVISFSVPGFSNYSIIETPVVVDDGDTGDDPGSSGGGSSGSSGGSPVISSIVNDIIINLDEVDKGSGEISLGELIYVIYNGATYSVEFDEQTNEAIRVIIGPDIGEYVILKDAVRIIDLDGVVGDDIAIAYTIVGDGVILYIEKIDGGVTPEHPSTVGEVIELEEEGDVKEDNGWIVWGILIGIVVIGIVLVIIRQNRKPQLVIGGVGHRQKLKNKKTVFEDKKVTRVGELS